MKRLAIILVMAASGVTAQESERDFEPLTRGIEKLLRDLFSEVEPALRELRETIDNLDEYEAPEMLPNGDIIIRRKTPLEPPSEPDEERQQPEGQTDEPIEL
jgi:hypothetical protein